MVVISWSWRDMAFRTIFGQIGDGVFPSSSSVQSIQPRQDSSLQPPEHAQVTARMFQAMCASVFCIYKSMLAF